MLDYSGNPAGAFVFQIGLTLMTAAGAQVTTIDGSRQSGLYWNIGSAAIIGIGTMFAGNVLAQTSITMASGANIMCSRAISLTTAVTLDTNIISNDCSDGGAFGLGRRDFGSRGFAGIEDVKAAVPEPATWALLMMGFGLTGAAIRRRQTIAAVSA